MRYPYYTVGEVATVFSISDDLARTLFRNGRQGPVLEIHNRRPGKRTYRTILIPYGTVMSFIARYTRDGTASASNASRGLRLVA